MTSTFSAGTYDTESSGSLGIDKSDKEPVVDRELDICSDEYNTVKSAVRQLELTVGDGSGVLTRYGDADEGNIRELLDFSTPRAERAMIVDHFVYAAPLFSEINTAGAADNTISSSAIGVRTITSAGATIEGWTQSYNHFYQRSSRFRARWYIDALSATNGDYLKIGLYRDATHYVMFHSTRAGGAWPAWTVEVNDGGSTDSDTLTATPAATSWLDMEINTTGAGAYFYYQRGTADEEYFYLSGQAPEAGYCAPYVAMISNVGGEAFSADVICCGDTRSL